MLITCNGCNSKIRVPDSAAGKRVKCPKCATLIRVPEVERPPQSSEPQTTGVSSTPLPPPPPAESEPEPQETPQKSVDPDAFSTTGSSSGSKPPPLKRKRASSPDDSVDEDDDDEPRTPGKRPRKYDDDDRDEDDEDDDDLDVRNRRGRSQPANGMATTSMIMGVTSVVFGVPGCTGCCCGIFTAIAAITGIVAVTLGYMGKSPGSETYTTTGIICGFVGIGLALIGLLWFILNIVFRVGMIGMNNF
jgi:predicted Zn finger-like uncharacterized protein